MDTGGAEGAMAHTLHKYTYRTHTHKYKYAYVKTGGKEGARAKGGAGKHQGMCALTHE